jgi:anion-transporting  ArsA/GET3 family ATPase
LGDLRVPTLTGLSDLLDRRLLIQSGKGGTGKTTVSAALALLAAERGQRVLLVEVDTHDRFASLFGRATPIGYDATEVYPGVEAMNLDPQLVMVDFFKTHMKFKAIYGQIVDSKVFQYFYAAAPGLRELICLGKIWRLLQEKRRGRPRWDLIVLDAPATGHGLAILNIAQAAHDTLFGPMKKHAGDIRDMLRSPETTLLNICAIPEEMPVNEATELYEKARAELEIPMGFLIMNELTRGVPGLTSPLELNPGALAALEGSLGAGAFRAVDGAASYHRLTAARTDEALARAGAKIPLPIVPVPYLFDADFDRRTLREVAEHLERGIEALAPRETVA